MKQKKLLILSSQARKTGGVKNPVLKNLYSFLKKNTDHKYDFYKSSFNSKFLFYLKLFSDLIRYKINNSYDIYHCHFGGLPLLFLGLLRLNSVSTYHGTDLHSGNDSNNLKRNLRKFINELIFKQYSIKKHTVVSANLKRFIPTSISAIVISVFSNFESFYPIDKDIAKRKLNLKKSKKYILFSDISSSGVKRLDLAKLIEVELKKYEPNYSLLIMSDVDPDMVVYYINSSEFILVTSDNEGSPSIIKECLLCNTPVYSYDVGDIKEYVTNKSGLIVDRELSIKKQAEKININHSNTQYRFNNSISKNMLIKQYEELYDI